MNAAALEFYDLIIFMRGPGAQRKKITALFGGMKEAIKEAFDHSFNIKHLCILVVLS